MAIKGKREQSFTGSMNCVCSLTISLSLSFCAVPAVDMQLLDRKRRINVRRAQQIAKGHVPTPARGAADPGPRRGRRGRGEAGKRAQQQQPDEVQPHSLSPPR